MDLGIKGKVAFVMAGSKGLGKGVAMRLSKEGVKVAIMSRNSDNLKKAMQDIKSETGKEILTIKGDVTKKSDLERAVNEIIEKYGTIHILFTNAGGPPAGNFFDVKPEQFEDAIKLNLMSTINAVYLTTPYMMKNKWGRIVASTSISVKQPLDNLILSNVSRAGVITFIKSISSVLAPFNITANAILPGYTMTERVKSLIENIAKKNKTTFQKAVENIIRNIPAGRMGSVEEFASTVAFLVSEKASYITGAALPIDGGFIKCI